MIAIYQGLGALWDGPDYPRIGVKEILENGLQKFSFMIMPGGRDRPYHAALKGEPNALLRKFVEEGGHLSRHLCWSLLRLFACRI